MGQYPVVTDFYLTLAQSLLANQVLRPNAGAAAADIKSFFDGAKAAKGLERIDLFGAKRMIDFSQFTPRGHYTKSEAMKQYFRAMMWLGRIDMRLIEILSNGDTVFRRDQYQVSLLLARLAAR